MDKFIVFSNIALWCVVFIQVVVTFMLSKMVADFMNRFRINKGAFSKVQLQPGDKAPHFWEEDHNGQIVKLSDPLNGPTLLLFTSEGCGICKSLYPHISSLRNIQPELRIMLLSDASLPDVERSFLQDSHYINAPQLRDTYLIDTVPVAVLVNTKGIIESIQTLSNYKQMLEFVKQSSVIAS